MNKGSLTGVGIGPGDPELITLKGYKALKQADIIFYPASSKTSDAVTSFSASILKQLDLKVPCQPLLFPMTGKKRDEFYRKAYQQVKLEVDNGKQVVVVSEGDLLFYSTFGYLLQLANNDGLNYTLIPGIPAFIAAGSRGNRPVVDGKSGLQVFAAISSLSQLEEALKTDSTLVIMKPSTLKESWVEFLSNLQRPFLYAERVGTALEFVTSKVEDIEQRPIPYFSIIIIY